MPSRDAGSRSVASRRYRRHAALLAGTSALAMLVYASPAEAVCVGRCSAGGVANAVSATAASALADAQRAAQVAQDAQNSLARATQAIRAMQAVQSAARSLAQSTPSSVPNGLVPGGLQPNMPAGWTGANAPTQTTSGGQTVVGIQQTAPQAILNWQTFNVGATTTVNFYQRGNPDWIVLNRVLDPSGRPSQILGQIKADGQVLLINRNGIIFGGASQVNVHTLIASALDLGISDGTFLKNGLYSTSQLPSGTSGAGAANFSLPGNGGKVIVQPGAVIDTSDSLAPNGDGGYVALLGNGGVTNAGTIIAQNGQIILASGNSITLTTPPSNAVGVGTAKQVFAGSAPVTNAVNGLLMSGDGAVTLAGGSINQLGGIIATTSTTRTASIGLYAACAGSCSTGADGDVVLGPASLTAILPDEASGALPTATANSTVLVNGATSAAPYFQAVLQPQIRIQASANVDIGSGALIKAPSAALTITAGSPGTILLEPGSVIDLSGLAGVTLPMSINEVSFKVTAAEVADDPLAANLIGSKVTIDARLSGTRADGFHWVGSPILDAAGYVGLIPESIDQLFTVGGTITTSAGNVVQRPGAVINVSGGYVQYLGGTINTTRLIGADGRIYNIGDADPNVAYLGLLTGFTVDHPRWNGNINLSEVYVDPLMSHGYYEPGYTAGMNAGSISVTAMAPILAGDIVANIVVGDRQRAMAGSSNLAASDQMPTGASLNIAFASGPLYTVVLEPQADAGPDPYGLSGLSFANASTWKPALANGAFPIFSDILSAASFSAISIQGANLLNMPAGAALVVRPGGSITLDGVATIDGLLGAPAGKISLTGFTWGNGANGPGVPPMPALVVGSDAMLDVHGLWVNAGLSSDQPEGWAFVNGGTVSITTLRASNGPGSNSGLPGT
ncbi:MAG: filamentous hemagglutinin N-terminal domain-containing protein, partial [Xanthobacteraceae bacterium]|nr:filamentous hemagglutinin N-terminal domain-containing protein [Xanthobacteraceae bacterium]